MPKIVLIENIETGRISPAVLPEGEEPGHNVFRRMAFTASADLLQIEDETLAEIMKSFELWASDQTVSKEQAADTLWRHISKTSAIYTPPQVLAEQKESDTMATKTKRAAKTEKKARAAGAGRKSAFVGKKIYKKVQDNPRREGTNGYNSFALIRNGMKYEDYVAAGGRPQDLAWDLKHDYVELKD